MMFHRRESGVPPRSCANQVVHASAGRNTACEELHIARAIGILLLLKGSTLLDSPLI